LLVQTGQDFSLHAIRGGFFAGAKSRIGQFRGDRLSDMALYLISYDIAEKDAFEYGPLWERLKTLGAVKILYSEWIISGGIGQSETIYNEIAPLTQKKDRLLIQEMTKDFYCDQLLISDDAFRAIVLKHARS
jgi:hypothetical protein